MEDHDRAHGETQKFLIFCPPLTKGGSRAFHSSLPMTLIGLLLPLSLLVLLMILVAMISANDTFPLEKNIKPWLFLVGLLFINLLLLTLDKIVGVE